MSNLNFRMALVASLALGASAATPAAAHHSYAMFDIQTETTLAGTVKKFDWTNPHTWVAIEVLKDSVAEEWDFEGMSPNYLARRGWSKETLKPGDKVAVTFHPLKEGQKGGSFISVVLASGRKMNMTGAN